MVRGLKGVERPVNTDGSRPATGRGGQERNVPHGSPAMAQLQQRARSSREDPVQNKRSSATKLTHHLPSRVPGLERDTVREQRTSGWQTASKCSIQTHARLAE